MKKLSGILFATLLLISNIFLPTNVFANANDFYFKNATFDYYLTKQSDGTSRMTVEETLVAVFPERNQNHGIERTIPFLNQNDTNLTMHSTTSLDIDVSRNDKDEKYTVKSYDDHFLVRIGDPDVYVHGEQTYKLKYEFINVITDFNESRYSVEPYQELYWDSNGTGWDQNFNELTVNLHMPDELYKTIKTDRAIAKTTYYTDKSTIHENNTTKEKLAAWCYIGKYGSSNQGRCKINDLDDGISFSTKNLAARENLTFVTNFDTETFIVPKNNYIKDLSIKDAKIDYYLSKDENGYSKLRVEEKIKASFPTKNTVRFFYRDIPFVDRNGTGFITDNQEHLNVAVKMDGEKVDYSTSPSTIDDGYFSVKIGDASDALHGEHDFELSYELKNIVGPSDDGFQFLYLDTIPHFYNDIENITATVHFEDGLENALKEIEHDDKNTAATCATYAQKKDENKSSISCDYSINGNTITYSATGLSEEKFFTITAYFKDDTFKIAEPNRNYVYFHIFGIVIFIIAIIFGIFYIKSYKKVGDKIKYLRSSPLVPQYIPPKNLTVGQAAALYIKPTKNPRIATMLELIVNKKIALKRGEKKIFGGYKWSGEVLDLSNISDEQRDLMKILNGGHGLNHIGDTFDIIRRPYSSSLEGAYTSYDLHVKAKLKTDGLLEPETKETLNSKLNSPFKIIAFVLLSPTLLFMFIAFCINAVSVYKKVTNFTPFSIYEGAWLLPIIIIVLFLTFLLLPILSGFVAKYKKITKKGLETTRYLDGLKHYIKMSEQERMEFLQSVKNVDTSEEGIVKLNERLLPYAALFGLEKSWMKELEKYYVLHEETKPDWYSTGFNYAVIGSVMSSATARPIDTTSSSSGSGGSWSSSSSSSGGGGGGFSGGGGGGGGGGGW